MLAPSHDTRVTFPWYDGQWLKRFVAVKAWLSVHRPARLQEFLDAVKVLRTRPDYRVQHVARVFDDPVLAKVAAHSRAFSHDKLELHEAKTFGRFVVHNDPWFTDLQNQFTGLVSDLAGEDVEPHYNFLSLYTRQGVCQVHMDAPEAKWTLDICIEQSAPWPIHFRQIVPWPEHPNLPATDWDRAIKESPDLRFESVALEPNQAVLFSGSSQWHYRDPLPNRTAASFCTLLFFHYIPRGSRPLVEWWRWPAIFGIPELQEVVGPAPKGR